MQIVTKYFHNSKYPCFILLILCFWIFHGFSDGAISAICSIRNPDLANETNRAYRIRPKAVEGKLSLSQTPRLYETAELTLHLESLINEPLKAKVRFVIPPGMFFVGEDSSFLQNPALLQDIYLPAKSTTQCSVTITAVKTGNYTLQASVYTSPEYHSTQHFYTYLSVSDTQSTFPKSEIQSVEVVRVTPKFAPRKADVRLLAAPAAQAGMVTVRGTAAYFDDNELRELPIRGLKVIFFDENNKSPDEVIAITYTNEQGEYDFSVKNIDREDNSKRDLYVVFYFENNVLSIQDRRDRFYEFPSEIIFDAQDGEWEFHLLLNQQDTMRGLGAIHNTIIEAHDVLMNKVGWERDAIQIRWPTSDIFSYYEVEAIGFHISEVINLIHGDEWQRIAIFHEYGHAVMTSAYGNDMNKVPFGNYDRSHWVFTVSDRDFAMSEGWAEFMEAAVDDDALNVTGYINADIPNIESNKWWTGDVDGNGSNTHGEIVEGAVASVFWDITDTAISHDTTPLVDDDGISDMFSQLWEILTNDRPKDIIEVASSWQKRNFDNYDNLELIYATHGILLRPNSPPAITITSPSSEGAMANTSYTITWIAYDKDNEAYTVDLFFDTDNIPGGETEIKTTIPNNVARFEWNTSKISEGRYYIYAIARDIRAGENKDYSDGPLMVDHSPLPPPVITSSTHPEQSRWYANNSPQFILKTTPYKPERQYSYVLNRTPDTIPDTRLEKDVTENSLVFYNLGDGTWWLHIRAQDDLGYWTDATHFQFNVDVSKPSRVENVHWVDGKTNIDGASLPILIELAWDAADDSVSGIAQYHISIYSNPAGVKSPNISVGHLFSEDTVDGNTLSKSFTVDEAYTYFARVRAEDHAGLLGDWSYISASVTVPRQHPWDVNRDNKVDIADLVLVKIHFGEEGSDADVNSDGVVDILDLVLVGQHFGE
ncbi:hypothetical protein FJZ31_25485 [Candidatus Poribacteria bacterium]|nr:hypothetical protein [Candidatus Poribacteria bacterium]